MNSFREAMVHPCWGSSPGSIFSKLAVREMMSAWALGVVSAAMVSRAEAEAKVTTLRVFFVASADNVRNALICIFQVAFFTNCFG